MILDIVTLFPDMFRGPLDDSIVGRSREAGRCEIRLHNLRDWARDKHRKVDDDAFGDGAGMVLKPEPLFACIEDLRREGPARVILLSPQGPLLTQGRCRQLAASDERLILVCGRYKGLDERFIEACVDEELSIGDYVLSGGELAAMVLVDGIVRLLPQALNTPESAESDSLEDGLLDAPQYTRPAEFRGLQVPEILLSGHHGRIAEWRQQQRVERTRRKRPDLYRAWTKENQ